MTEFAATTNASVDIIMIGPTLDCPKSKLRGTALSNAMKERGKQFGINIHFAPAEMEPLIDNVRSAFGFKAAIGRGHFNEKGHTVMAHILADIIRSRITD